MHRQRTALLGSAWGCIDNDKGYALECQRQGKSQTRRASPYNYHVRVQRQAAAAAGVAAVAATIAHQRRDGHVAVPSLLLLLLLPMGSPVLLLRGCRSHVSPSISRQTERGALATHFVGGSSSFLRLLAQLRQLLVARLSIMSLCYCRPKLANRHYGAPPTQTRPGKALVLPVGVCHSPVCSCSGLGKGVSMH